MIMLYFNYLSIRAKHNILKLNYSAAIDRIHANTTDYKIDGIILINVINILKSRKTL